MGHSSEQGRTRANPRDTALVLSTVLAPTVGTGVIARRPRMMALAQRHQFDLHAVRTLRQLREKYGNGPLWMRVAGRNLAMVLSERDVNTILVDNAADFTPANAEKHAALRHFQPHGSLISTGDDRQRRRKYNEAVLETARPLHHLAGHVQSIADDQAQRLGELAVVTGGLNWQDFAECWWRTVRTVVFGAAARDDRRLTALLNTLRSDANWAFAHPRRPARRREFDARLRAHLEHADAGSLAAALPESSETDPAEQIPHWLFAFDAAGIVAYRTLALLASHPEQERMVREELDAAGDGVDLMPYLRGSVMESVRLWPTTPVVLRDSVRETTWDGTPLPKGTGFVAFAPLFHRDETTVRHAHEFAPQSWLDDEGSRHAGTVPFSAGPGRCPGENLVLLITTALLAGLLRRRSFAVEAGIDLGPSHALPMTLDNFGLEFRAFAR